MPGDFNAVSGTEVGKNLALGFFELFFDQGNFFLDADSEGMSFRVFSEFFEFGLQFDNRLLEIEMMFHQRQET